MSEHPRTDEALEVEDSFVLAELSRELEKELAIANAWAKAGDERVERQGKRISALLEIINHNHEKHCPLAWTLDLERLECNCWVAYELDKLDDEAKP